MVKIVLYVAGLSVLVAVAVWFAETPGKVTLEWLGWRLDTSVAMLFVLVTALLVLGTFLIRTWGTLVGAGRALRDARKDKRLNRGLDALAYGFSAVRGGDPAAAAKAGREAKSALGDRHAVTLLLQQTARVNGDRNTASAEARNLLTEPAMEAAALRDLAEAAMQAGDREGALGHAVRALGRKPPLRWAGEMTLNLQVALGRWEEAALTAERKDVQGVLDNPDMTQIQAALYSQAAQAALIKQETAAAIKWARKALSADPARPDASATLGRALIAGGKAKKASVELERAWTVNPHPLVMSAYLQIAPAEAPLARASRIEKLVSGYPDHSESRLALAEVALAADLWGQARNRLEPLLDKGTAPAVQTRAAALMARVDLGDSGDTKAATKFLVTALEARSATPDRPAPTSIADLLSRPV